MKLESTNETLEETLVYYKQMVTKLELEKRELEEEFKEILTFILNDLIQQEQRFDENSNSNDLNNEKYINIKNKYENLKRNYEQISKKHELLANSKLGKLTLLYWNLKRKFFRKGI